MTPSQEAKAGVYKALGYRVAGEVGEFLTVAKPLPSGKNGYIVQVIAPNGKTVKTMTRRR